MKAEGFERNSATSIWSRDTAGGFVWAAIFGWLVFREVPSPFTLAGAVLIVGGCWIAARAVEHPALETAA